MWLLHKLFLMSVPPSSILCAGPGRGSARSTSLCSALSPAPDCTLQSATAIDIATALRLEGEAVLIPVRRGRAGGWLQLRTSCHFLVLLRETFTEATSPNSDFTPPTSRANVKCRSQTSSSSNKAPSWRTVCSHGWQPGRRERRRRPGASGRRWWGRYVKPCQVHAQAKKLFSN